MMNDGTTQQSEFILRRLSEGPSLFRYELHPGWWLFGLGVVLILAIAYVVRMYIIDSRSVHPLFAIALGTLRCLVFALLGVAFLLPSCQHWEKAEKSSRMVILLDVSESVTRISDDIPSASRPADKL